MSDWEKSLRKVGREDLANKIHTEKSEDMKRLKNSGLPQFEYFETPYLYFRENNKSLMNFIDKHLEQGKGFCIRALPTEEGIKKGLTRRPTMGYFNYEEMNNFLEEVTEDKTEYWKVGLSDWEPGKYGGVVVVKNFAALGEIARELDKLTGGLENPLAGFELGISQIAKWYVEKDKDAKEKLWEAFQIVRENPKINKIGYFEFVTTEKNGNIKFLDYKINASYLNLI